MAKKKVIGGPIPPERRAQKKNDIVPMEQNWSGALIGLIVQGNLLLTQIELILTIKK